MAKSKSKFQSKSTKYAFEAENFPFITMKDFKHTWNKLDLKDLQKIEQEGLMNLLNASGISKNSGFEPNGILLVKASGGVLSAVYGPGIFRDDNKIILKVGDHATDVVQNGDRLTVGELKGKITVTAGKDAGGREYPIAQVNFVSPDKDIFKVRISLDTQNNELAVGDLEAMLINEEPILEYLGQVPGQVMKMQELGIGEFAVKAISSTNTQYGEAFKLHLADGRVVWARGNSELLLRSGYEMQADTPLTLIISEIEEYTEGKFKVTNALRERLPQLKEGANPVVETLEAQISPVKDSHDEFDTEIDEQTDEQEGAIPF